MLAHLLILVIVVCFLVLFTGVLFGLLWLAHWAGRAGVLVLHTRERRLRKAGRCIHCGYDLRASKDRCPECGTPFPNEGTIKGRVLS